MNHSVFGVVADHARRNGDAPALTSEHGAWTYQELCDEVAQVAGGLAGLGARKGDRVLVAAGSRPEVLITWLACSMSGLVVSVVNAALTSRELAPVIDNLGPALVLVDDRAASTVRAVLDATGATPRVVSIDDGGGPGPDWRELTGANPYVGPLATGDDLVEVAYTSGSSGTPKGALFTNAAHLFSMGTLQRHFDLTEHDVCYSATPLFHASGTRASNLLMLVVGGHTILAPSFDPVGFWDRVRAWNVTYMTIVETMLIMLDAQPPAPDDAENPVRLIFTNGGASLLRRFEDRFGVTCVQPLGSTEYLVACLTPLDVPRAQVQAERDEAPSSYYVGRPLDGVELRLLDDDGKEVAPGAIGQFWVRSPGMLSEYFNAPQINATAFRDGWVTLGDLGQVSANGAVYFIERRGGVIKRAGELVVPREIEDVLREHPAVRLAAVVGVPDPVRVQEAKAYVALDPSVQPPPSAEDIWAWCTERLVKFKVPRYIEFRDDLPATPTGKLLKRELPQTVESSDGPTFDRFAEDVPRGTVG